MRTNQRSIRLGAALAVALVGCGGGGGEQGPSAAELAAQRREAASEAAKTKLAKRKAAVKPVAPRRRLPAAPPEIGGSAVMQDLSMTLVYVDEGAGVWSCLDLLHGRGVIQQDDLEPTDFRQVRGGLRLYRQRVYCFLDSEAGGDLTGYVRFLLGSLAGLGGSSLDPGLAALRSAKKVGALPDVVGALRHRDQSQLVLQENPDRSLRLSYLDPQGQVPTQRLVPYFDGLLIDRGAWVRACCEALEEYFQLVARLKQQAVKPDAELDQLEALWKRANVELRKLSS